MCIFDAETLLTMSVNIEKKVKIPERVRNGKPFKYPWGELKVGDSFYMPHQYSPVSMVNNYNSGVPKEKRIKITRRIEGDGQRVWRIK